MISPAQHHPIARACRAWVFALICVLLSASGHALTAGHTFSMSTLVFAAGFLVAVAWAVADRRRGLLPITTGLLAGQGFLHLWFAADPLGHPGHTETAAASAELPTPAMLLAHCLAALLCGIWLWWGERTAFSLASALYTRILVPLLALVAPAPVGRPTVTEHCVRTTEKPAAVEFLRHALPRRGPPEAENTSCTLRRGGITG